MAMESKSKSKCTSGKKIAQVLQEEVEQIKQDSLMFTSISCFILENRKNGRIIKNFSQSPYTLKIHFTIVSVLSKSYNLNQTVSMAASGNCLDLRTYRTSLCLLFPVFVLSYAKLAVASHLQ